MLIIKEKSSCRKVHRIKNKFLRENSFVFSFLDISLEIVLTQKVS